MKRLILLLWGAMLFLIIVHPAYATFISDSSGNLFNYDITTNSSTLIGNSGVGAWYDIALDPVTNTLYGITGWSKFYSIDVTTGKGTFIGNAGVFVNGLTFDDSGTLYGSGSKFLYSIDTSSASTTTIGNTGYNSSGDLAFDSSGNLYMAAWGAGSNQLVRLDPSTGAGTSLGSFGYTGVYGLSFEDAHLYAFTMGGYSLDVDMTNGSVISATKNNIRAYGATGRNPVPEPATMLLLGTGLVCLAGARFRKKKLF